jgi:hypothetical protein
MRLSLTGIWRDNKNFVNSVATAAQWTPIQLETDLGDTQTFYRWENREDSNTDYLIRNVKGFQYLSPDGQVIGTADPFRRYRAFMAVLNKRYENRWQAQISYVYAKSTGNVDNTGSAQVAGRQFETPNLALVNAEGPVSWTPNHEFKILGGYQIPRIETMLSGFFVTTSGLPYARVQQFSNGDLNTTGLSSTYRRLNIAPRGAYRLPTLSHLDLRLEKTFDFSANRIGIYADFQNIFNRGTVTETITRPQSVTLIDGSTFPLPFDTPAEIQDPRQIRIGARWSF